MLNIIHTSDWHIGLQFFKCSRLAEQEDFLDWLLGVMISGKTDLLLVSGDIFDVPSPSSEVQSVFYSWLRRVKSGMPELQIVFTAGNHDSAARLEAPEPFLRDWNIKLSGRVDRKKGVTDFDKFLVPVVKAGSAEAVCLAVPYLRVGDYPGGMTYEEGVRAFYDSALSRASALYPGIPVIALGHLSAASASVSEDDPAERQFAGGLDWVDLSGFAEKFSYFALGHLHRCQKVRGAENIMYSGSPLKMSFAEKGRASGIIGIELDEGVLKKKEFIEYRSPVKLISATVDIPDEARSSEIEDIIGKSPVFSELQPGQVTKYSPFVEIKIRSRVPRMEAPGVIDRLFAGKAATLTRVLQVLTGKEEAERGKAALSLEDLVKLDPVEIAGDYYLRRTGSGMPEQAAELIKKIMLETD